MGSLLQPTPGDVAGAWGTRRRPSAFARNCRSPRRWMRPDPQERQARATQPGDRMPVIFTRATSRTRASGDDHATSTKATTNTGLDPGGQSGTRPDSAR